MAVLRRREPVDAAVDAVGQQYRGERVEVVLVRQEKHGRDLLERAPRPVRPRAATGCRSSPACLICSRCSSRPAHISTSRPADRRHKG